MVDIVTFAIPKSIIDPKITISMVINGSIVGSGPSGSGSVHSTLQATSPNDRIIYPGSNAFQVSNGSGDFSRTLVTTFEPTAFATDVGDSWMLQVKVRAEFFAFGNPNYVFDFSNTARLGIDLTEGITYTSDSGLLLTAVPEPSSAVLLLAGLGVLVSRVVRRRN